MELVIDKIKKEFNGNQILQGINLVLESKKCHLLLGKNGSGKTTLVRIIDGELKQDSGTMHLSDKQTLLLEVAVQYQDFNIFPNIRIKELIEFFKKITKDYYFDWELYELLEIEKIGSNFVKSASGGEKKSVAIFLAVLLNKPVIILDEPFADLDLEKKKNLNQFLIKYVKENDKVLLVISHEVNEYKSLFNTVSIMDKGIILESDTIENLQNKYSDTSILDIENIFYKVTGKRLVESR
ncbi:MULTISPECIES: ATP-binding cassette domain-containing protein [Bacillus]|uniref:ABC transporter ATP-binding protein n=2 Tax=Bacillus cereus TaxID=1396 RepID=Q815M3_BACCR|nr:ATP-binding cassette domain-containing protein [Bacillus cereus]AAP11987.1 ABC transporter ATP-binding protein [Bacillus cereus ATCC 14579]ETT80138.1 ABC transporter ATP-binding protein [Bacillus cereus]MCC3288473.1 ATP-binding cassette domain-containing protein [Bacillus cereus]MEB9997481.1 ATP-binding cassette domain-containing protein [Bacillus cereus]OOR40194.1 ABC transporter ATP-binding protein [Bacillus cereus]